MQTCQKVLFLDLGLMKFDVSSVLTCTTRWGQEAFVSQTGACANPDLAKLTYICKTLGSGQGNQTL